MSNNYEDFNLTNEDIIAIYSLGPNYTKIYYNMDIIAKVYNLDINVLDLIWNDLLYTEITYKYKNYIRK